MSGSIDLRPVLPALIVAVSGLAVLLVQAFTPRGKRSPVAAVSMVGLFAALVTALATADESRRGTVLGGSVAADHFSLFFHVLILGIGILVILLSSSYLKATDARGDRGEYYALTLFAIVGMLGLVSALELISLFVALEIMSISVYALAGYHRDRPESQESAVKYFITGAFSSAFFLYGMALLYGVAGSTSLHQIARATAHGSDSRLAILGIGMLLVGLGFKVASVPFHMWAPDVYEGAPTTVTAFMSAGVKAAAFGVFLRIFGHALPGMAEDWQPAVAVLAVVTMVVGNLGALAQGNLKRMLAYSSVAHAGYLMTAMVAVPPSAVEAVLFYLVAYAAVNLGAFGALSALARDGREPLTLGDVAGLAHRRPALAAALTVFLVSLTGIPVSAGFVGKFYLFRAAIAAGYVTLAIVGVLMSVVSAYYYLRVVVSMYMRDPTGEDTWAPIALSSRLALAFSVLVVLGFGVYPGPLLGFARLAAQAFR